MTVKLEDIELGIEFASTNYGCNEAYIDIERGTLHLTGDAVDEPIPDDLDNRKKYYLLPDKRKLDLGKNLAIRFASEDIPDHLDTVYDIFRKQGAYSYYKNLLNSLGKLEDWYAYEELALKKAMIDWCKENNINFS